MDELKVTPERLLPGTRREKDGSLTLPKDGGGILLPELKGPGPRFLSFDLTALQEHSQAFELRFFAGEAAPRFLFRFGVLPDFPARVSMDLAWLDGHILFPGHPPGMLKTVCHGSRIAREEITRAELVNCACHHDVRVRLSGLRLTDEPPAPLPLPDVKLMDSLGQLKGRSWPGKTEGVEDLKAALTVQSALPDRWPAPEWSRFGGYAPVLLDEGSGFFTRVKKSGRWHIADPEGHPFFSAGMDCVTVSPDCRVDGMESLLDWLPGTDDPAYGGMYGARMAP